MNRESEGKSIGIPHLAKNERDVGHPSLVREPEPMAYGLGASAAGNYRQSADKNLEIEPDTPVLDVGRIEGDVAVKRGVLARLYLPQSRHAGKHVEAPQMA